MAGVILGVDAIREFRVEVSNFSAAYGRAGGGIFNMISKSGTLSLRPERDRPGPEELNLNPGFRGSWFQALQIICRAKRREFVHRGCWPARTAAGYLVRQAEKQA